MRVRSCLSSGGEVDSRGHVRERGIVLFLALAADPRVACAQSDGMAANTELTEGEGGGAIRQGALEDALRK